MWRWLAILVLGGVLGFGSAVLAIRHVGGLGAVRVGPWSTPLDGGGTGRDMYTRAAVALSATLALSRQETLYFRAAVDSQGRALVGNCSYTVHGPDLPARWWSITLYGADHFLIANPRHKYSYASDNIARGPDGGFSIAVTAAPQPGNWLDPEGAAGLVLLTRLYRPSDRAASDPRAIALPAIDRGACR
jgi:hypothetical protein